MYLIIRTLTVAFAFVLYSQSLFGQTPVVTGFAPTSGPAGTTITITGSNFSINPADNIVLFGVARGQVQSASAGSLTVTVPFGATYQPVSVTVNRLIAYASSPFIITFPGAGTNFTAASFATAPTYPIGSFPVGIAAADFNGDDKPDVISLNKASDNASIYRNTGTGTNVSFALALTLSTGVAPNHVSGTDLNGDGLPDLVIVNLNNGGSGSISVYKNVSAAGSTAFAPRVDYATANGPVSCAVRDIDGDNLPDIIVATGNGGVFSVFRNIGTGGNIAFASPVNFTHLLHGDNVSVNDFDGDGKADIALANFSGQSVSVYRNISTPGNFLFSPKIDYAAESIPNSIATGDLNNDGKNDIAVTNSVSRTVSVYKNNGVSNISFESGANLATLKNPRQIIISDLDGDGKPDLLVCTADTGFYSIFKNISLPGGTIQFAPRTDILTPEKDEIQAVAADINADGKPDLAMTNSYTKKISVFKNRIGSQVVKLCPPAASATISASLTAATYQWQADNGTGFSNISDNVNYAGTNTGTLQLNNIPSSWYEYKYRCLAGATADDVFVIRFSNTWTGAVNGLWENPANWSCGAVPDSNTDVVISAGNISVNSNVSIRTLQISSSAVLTVTTGNTLTVLY